MDSKKQLSRFQWLIQPILIQGMAGLLLIVLAAIAAFPILADEPKSPLDALTIARTARDQNKLGEAIQNYQKVIQTTSDNTVIATAEMELAWIYAYQKNYSASLALCDRLVERNPNSEMFQLQRAEILSWAKRYSDSLQAYQQILTKNPKSLLAQVGQAEVLSWSGRYDEAIHEYQEVLSQQADNEKALTGIAQIALWQGDLDKSLQQFLTLREQFPKSIPTQLGLAETYQARQELKNALDVIYPLIEARNEQAIAISQEIHSIQSDTEVAIRNRSSNQNRFAINQTIKFRLVDSDILQSLQLGYGKFTQPDRQLIQTTPIRIGIEGTSYPTRWQLLAGADIFDRLSTQPFIEGQVTTQISPTFQVGATANYQLYKENIATLENGIKILRIQPYIYWQFTPSTSVYAQYGTGFYSDGNSDSQLWTRLRQKIDDFYVEASIFSWSFVKDLNNGYFAPSDYLLYGAELGWQGEISKSTTCNFGVSFGRQSYSSESRLANGYKGVCNLKLSNTTTINAQYLYTNNSLFTGTISNDNEQRFQVNLKTKF